MEERPKCFGTGPDSDCTGCSFRQRCYFAYENSKKYSDAELTDIYNKANDIPPGKASPITTERIFKAMRYCIEMNKK